MQIMWIWTEIAKAMSWFMITTSCLIGQIFDFDRQNILKREIKHRECVEKKGSCGFLKWFRRQIMNENRCAIFVHEQIQVESRNYLQDPSLFCPVIEEVLVALLLL